MLETQLLLILYICRSMYLFYETHHDLMNSLRHCTNFAVGVHLPRSSRSNYPHRRPNKLRHHEGYAQTFDSGRTGTDQLTTSRVTFSDALFRGSRDVPFPPVFQSLFFLAPFRFCFLSSLALSRRGVSQFFVLEFFVPLSHLLSSSLFQSSSRFQSPPKSPVSG